MRMCTYHDINYISWKGLYFDFDYYNDYDPTSMSLVMMLVGEMVQNLKIVLRGVHGTHISFFFRQIFIII